MHIVETLISQMRSSVQSGKFKKVFEAHLGIIQQQVENGVEDIFCFAEGARSSVEQPSDIRAHAFPFGLQNASQRGMPQSRSRHRKK